MSNWRNDPASDAQKQRLTAERIEFPPSITKGEASALISAREKPSQDDLAILRFFKIRDATKLYRLEARKKIKEIFSDQKNKERWENRRAVKSQQDTLQFFSLPIPSKLTHKQARQQIDELFEDKDKLEAWENHLDALEEREEWFEMQHEYINEDCAMYYCKKISKKLFKEAVTALEASGMTLRQIEDNEDLFFKKAIEINPNIRRAGGKADAYVAAMLERNVSTSFGQSV